MGQFFQAPSELFTPIVPDLCHLVTVTVVAVVEGVAVVTIVAGVIVEKVKAGTAVEVTVAR